MHLPVIGSDVPLLLFFFPSIPQLASIEIQAAANTAW
jgi:hypothetical protein